MPEEGINMDDMRALLAKAVAFDDHYLQAPTAIREGFEYVPIGRR
jgi:hypothetical protein